MPRGGRSRGRSFSPVRSAPPRTTTTARAPAPAPAPARTSAPVAQAPQQTAVGQPRQGPGMLGQIASTAAGVAIGSAVGHTIGHAMTGGGGGGSGGNQPDVTYQEPSAAQPYGAQPYQQQQQQPAQYCQFELKQFLECAQSTHDISLCDGFNQALKDCKVQYGVQ
ncbi:coiled-coil-helix-coiled-coil-helix domain-containing protein 2-like [Saccoglossus kowalevskii]|uniref:Coiled-coil-helix-coiled-coil-helix domain-containing protein 2, mitochondrial-like n=1 Tax=Saccoglossus kowalevskii TaxID=10224 RepID=A0ABM0GXC6_SACKO|nr:PREDICTED: coiled-coil-helix-coiled-coil-helix domain-containing protein 2, mitochondrial-like [Saccoglossus kowalevskii]